MNLGLGLGLGRNVRSFNNLAFLFNNGEGGAWYDPSDLTTLFQDAAGTIPVTHNGQPVGKILDKSGNGHHLTQSDPAKRPIYRNNTSTISNSLITNPDDRDFTTDTGFWTKGANWTISGGVATKSTSANTSLQKDALLTVGYTYLVDVDIVSRTSGTLRAISASGGYDVTVGSEVGVYSIAVTPSGGTGFLNFGGDFIGSIDNVNPRRLILCEGVSPNHWLDFSGGQYLSTTNTDILRDIAGASLMMGVEFSAIRSYAFPFFVSKDLAGGTLFGVGVYTSPQTMQAFGRRLTSDTVKNINVQSVSTDTPYVVSVQYDHTSDSLSSFVDGVKTATLTPFQGVGSTSDVASAVFDLGRFAGDDAKTFTGKIYGMALRVPVVADSLRRRTEKYIGKKS